MAEWTTQSKYCSLRGLQSENNYERYNQISVRRKIYWRINFNHACNSSSTEHLSGKEVGDY